MLVKKVSPVSEGRGLLRLVTSTYGSFGESGCIDHETNKIDNSRAKVNSTDCVNKHFEQFGVEMPVIFSFSVYIIEICHGYNMYKDRNWIFLQQLQNQTLETYFYVTGLKGRKPLA